MKGKNNVPPKVERSPETKLNQLRARAAARGHVDAFEWSIVDANLLAQLVHVSTSEGLAIQFGITKQGGAGTISFWDYQHNPEIFYLRPSEDSDSDLQGFIQSIRPDIQ
jgi:hypothetical protein